MSEKITSLILFFYQTNPISLMATKHGNNVYYSPHTITLELFHGVKNCVLLNKKLYLFSQIINCYYPYNPKYIHHKMIVSVDHLKFCISLVGCMDFT